MKYYKDKNNNIFAFEDDTPEYGQGVGDEYTIPKGYTLITEEEADVVVEEQQKPKPENTEIVNKLIIKDLIDDCNYQIQAIEDKINYSDSNQDDILLLKSYLRYRVALRNTDTSVYPMSIPKLDDIKPDNLIIHNYSPINIVNTRNELVNGTNYINKQATGFNNKIDKDMIATFMSSKPIDSTDDTGSSAKAFIAMSEDKCICGVEYKPEDGKAKYAEFNLATVDYVDDKVKNISSGSNNGVEKPVGFAQVWKSLTKSRRIGTEYKNGSRSIQVAVSADYDTKTKLVMAFMVNNITIGYIGTTTSGSATSLCVIVPANATYCLKPVVGSSVSFAYNWAELS